VLNFKEIRLADKPLFDRLLNRMQPEVSDLTFTNFYMWRETYGLRICYQPELDYLFLSAKPKMWKAFFFVPLGDWEDAAALKAARKYLESFAAAENMPLLFRRTPAKFEEALTKIGMNLSSGEDRNTFDYVYEVAELINLAGRRFHDKRNHLNQFTRRYAWEYLPLTGVVASEILALNEEWLSFATGSVAGTDGEIAAMATVLKNYPALNLVGGALRIDGKIQAFTVGELLNKHTLVVHIEKANTGYSGIYSAINREFLANHWRGVEFVNREEDMGMAGLRKAKLSYNPVRLVKKYNLSQ